MNRADRHRLNLLSNAIEGGAERLVTWLRAKAERKPRPKPLAFPTPMEEMMQRIYAPMIDRLAKQAVVDILRDGVSAVKVSTDEREGVVFTRIPFRDLHKPHDGPIDNRVFPFADGPDWKTK